MGGSLSNISQKIVIIRLPLVPRAILKFFIICSLMLSGGSAWATNLADAYNAAKSHDPVLGAARAGLDATKQIIPQARSQLLPFISSGWNKTWTTRRQPGAVDFFGNQVQEQDFNQQGWQVQLRQPIFNLERWYTYTSSKASVESAEYSFVATEQTLIVRTINAYLDVLRADALLTAVIKAEEAVERQLEQVQQRFDVGLVAITDVLEAQAVYDNSIVTRVQAVGDHDIFFEVLRTLAGEPYVAIDYLSESLPIVDPEPGNEEEWVRVALATNPNVLAAEAQLTAANRTLRARWSSHLPTIDGTVSESAFESEISDNTVGLKTESSTYGISISMPIYQGGFTHSRAKEAEAQRERARQMLQDSRLTVSRDTRNLFRAVTTDVVRVRARLKAIESATSALDATQTGYEVGTRNIVDVLNATNSLYSSQFDYADSRFNYVRSLINLKQLAGTLSAADLNDVSSYTDPNQPVGRQASLAIRTVN